MKMEKKTLVLSLLLIVVAVSAFFGTLTLKPTVPKPPVPSSTPRPTATPRPGTPNEEQREKYYYNNNAALIMQVYEACFRLFTYDGFPLKGFYLFVVIAVSAGASCFLIRRALYKHQKRKFYERRFSRYVTTCIISCLIAYLLMTVYFEEQLDDSWLMPPWISESFLVVFSLLMGWSLTYVPTRKESLEYWGESVPEDENI